MNNTENSTSKENTDIQIGEEFIIGPNQDIFYVTDGCQNNCSNKGYCLNQTCFCEQGFSYEDCTLTYKEELNLGYSFKKWLKWMIVSTAATMGATLVFLFFRRFQKLDHSELE